MDTKLFKQNLLDELYKPYQRCLACPLATQGRTKVVFGAGNADAKLMIIGEAPGQEEDTQGLPFVGRSGKLLSQIFEIIGIQRTDIYITNIVKCRPPGNRKPLPEESTICKKLLLNNQIKIIRPAIICTLGAAAIEGIFEKNNTRISKLRGTTLSYDHITLIPTYHPAYILRNPKELPYLVDDITTAYKLSQKTA